MKIEMDDVLGQPADIADDAATLRWRRFRRNDDIRWSPQHAIGSRAGLAHQDIALLRLEPCAPGRLLPSHVDIAAHDSCAACAAGPGGAFVGKVEALPQPSM